jgi:hypothetical protein
MIQNSFEPREALPLPIDLTIQWLPLLPGWVILVTATLFVALLLHGSFVLRRKQVPGRRVLNLACLRLLIGAVLVLLLLRPVVSYSRNEEQLPELIVLVDTSQSMGMPGGKEGQSRLDDVRATLDGPLGSSLRGNFRLRYFTFDRTPSPLPDGQLGTLQPLGKQTLYADSLAAAVELQQAEGHAPERVLLASDGNDQGADDPAATARRLGLMIDTLAPGSPEDAPPLPAVALVDVQAARRVLLGSLTQFRITLRALHARGLPAPVTVRLTEDGKDVASARASFLAGQTDRWAELSHRPATAGSHRYEFRLEDGPPTHALTVQVVDGKTEVLILEDTWRWEFKYLRRVFEDDPSFRFTAVLSRGAGAVVQFGSPDRRARLIGLPQGRSDLLEFDTLVVGDVDVRRWPPRLAAALAGAVREEGKSLIVVAGPNVGTLAEVPELHTLLPVELARESSDSVGGPVEVRVSPDGVESPFAVSARGDLPPLDQVYPPLRKRAGATVLLEASRLKNSYGNLIVLAEHTVGRGRVLYVGTDTLWKWQTKAEPDPMGQTPYRHFWQQALRALTPTQPRRPGVNLTLQAERSRVGVGRPMRLRAEVESDRPLARAEVRATVTLPDDRRVPLTFAAEPTDPGLWRAEFAPAEGGAYRVSATLTAGGQTAAEAEALFDVHGTGSEQADAGVDRAALERLAAATGGTFIDPARPETWPQPGPEPRPVVARARTVDLWENFALVFVLVGLLGIDWLVRLRRGFV